MNVWWWNRGTCGSGKGTEQPRDNAEVRGGAGESKRKEFKYSNFKNSCPCKITEMKAEIQLVEEAAITCSYCQSNAHSRIVQPLCKLDCYVQICSVPLLHGAEDWKPWAAQRRSRWHFRGPTSSKARPTGACWDHTAFLLAQALGIHQVCGATPGSDHQMWTESTRHQHQVSSGSAKGVSIMQTPCSFSTQKVTLRL